MAGPSRRRLGGQPQADHRRHPAASACWLGLVGLQVYRAPRVEQVLLLALPGYRAYRGRTAALLPGIF